VCFKKPVDVLPYLGQPVNDLGKVRVAIARSYLVLNKLALEVTTEEALDRLHMVGTQHPAEVVVQLEVGSRACCLIHCANDVRTAPKKDSMYLHLQ
jgi:hypothetical protein